MDARTWDERYRAAASTATATPVWHVGPNLWVREATENLLPARAVDLAAGEGRHAIWLAERGWTVAAVDFSAVGLARGEDLARERGVAHRITWTVADVVAAPPAPATADLVVVAYLHLPAPEMRVALRGGAAALVSGGTLVVVAHHSANLAEGVGGPRDPAVLYSPDDVAAHLDGTGLVLVRAEMTRREVAGAERPALDTVVVARRD